MSLRKKLPWFNKRNKVDPVDPPLADTDPPPADTDPPPADTDPSPRIVFLGAEPRTIGLMEVYRLDSHPDIVVADRRPELLGSDYQGRRVIGFDSLTLDRLEAAIVTEDPIGEYADALEFLQG